MKMSPKGQDSITSRKFVVNQCQIGLHTNNLTNVSTQIYTSPGPEKTLALHYVFWLLVDN